MDFQNMFQTQGMLFLLMLLGFLLKKKGMINEGNKGLLSDLVINVTLPASIIKAFQIEFNREILQSGLVIFLVAVGIQLGSYLLAAVLYQKVETGHKKVLQYATICSNAGILGNPIAEGIFGSLGLLYASFYLIPQRTFMWSMGLTYFTEAPDRKSLVKKIATHPCILAVVFGIIIMVFQIPLPGVIDQTVKSLAGANTAVSMLFIGSILTGVRFADLWTPLTIYYNIVRLFLVPLLVWLCLLPLGLDELVTGVSVVLAAMPAASVTAIMASKYHCDEVFATKCVVSTTILSMITIPLWCLFLG